MKKKNLVVLLILPFIISLLGIVTVNVTIKTVEKDILGIEWPYDVVEAFQIKEDGTYRLYATPVTERNAPLAPNNDLVWDVKNKNTDEDAHGEIVYDENGNAHLKTLSEGEVLITCANKKGSVSKVMEAIIYKEGYIALQTKIRDSQNKIDNTLYFGEYDLTNGNKTNAVFDLDLKFAPVEMEDTIVLESKSDNVEYDFGARRVSVLSEGDAHITLSGTIGDVKVSYSYEFTIVNDGVNVYTYDDLLNCTNRSKTGEIVVLRKSFESISNSYTKQNGEVALSNGVPVKKATNVENFGNYNVNSKSCEFSSDVYRTKTTYGTKFIEQWNNDFASKASNYSTVSDQIVVGLRVQKDFYGNGYTLNLHNLTYPYAETPINVNGTTVNVPTLTSKNLFRGPLPFYALGDPNNLPLVSLYGQDNVGVYVEGDNVTVNDVYLKNCDFGSSFSNLKYTGTVLEIAGNNVTVKNSQISNGKNVVRAFSAENAKISNCVLSNAQNFLLFVGANEIYPINESLTYDFMDENGATKKASLKDYFVSNGIGDSILTSYMAGTMDPHKNGEALRYMQDALNTGVVPSGVLPIEISVENTFFYKSGVASIALDTAFNGPFLYAKTPSIIETLFKNFSMEGRNLVPYLASNVSGISRPVRVAVSGNSKFFDYKTAEQMDLSGLIDENISSVLSGAVDILGSTRKITIDDLFPLKSMLYADSAKSGKTYSVDGKTYLNVAVAYYGGGKNLSEVDLSGVVKAEEYSEPSVLDWVEEYLKNSEQVDQDDLGSLKRMVQRMVTVVTGFENFKFTCMEGNGYLYGEAPKVSDLRENVRG